MPFSSTEQLQMLARQLRRNNSFQEAVAKSQQRFDDEELNVLIERLTGQAEEFSKELVTRTLVEVAGKGATLLNVQQAFGAIDKAANILLAVKNRRKDVEAQFLSNLSDIEEDINRAQNIIEQFDDLDEKLAREDDIKRLAALPDSDRLTELATFFAGESKALRGVLGFAGFDSDNAASVIGTLGDLEKQATSAAQKIREQTESALSRQTGGPLAAGQLALVGEAGPELFVPRTSGDVLKNEDTMTVLAAAGARMLQGGTAGLEALGGTGGAVAAGARLFGALFGLDEDGKPLTPEGILEKAALVREGLAAA